MLAIGDRTELMDTIECIKKYYATQSMGELEDFIGCTIMRDLTKNTLNIHQPDLINKTTQIFNKDVKSFMNFNAPATPTKGVVFNQEIDTQKT